MTSSRFKAWVGLIAAASGMLSSCLNSNSEFRTQASSGITLTALAADTFGLGDTSLVALQSRLAGQIALVPGQSALFYGSASPNSVELGWRWDFGDGSASSQRAAKHAYESPGGYHAVFSAHDSAGFSVHDTVNVVVTKISGAAVRGFVCYQGKTERNGIEVLFQPKGQKSAPIALVTDETGRISKPEHFPPDLYKVIYQDARYSGSFASETLQTVEVLDGKLHQFAPVELKDRHNPRIMGQYPIGRITMRQPSIGAFFVDTGSGIAPGSFVLRLNGDAIKISEVTTDTGSFSWKPTNRLSDGTYEIKAEVKDSAGNPATKVWSFQVDAIKWSVEADTLVSIGDTISLKIRIRDVFGTISKFYWDLNADGKWDREIQRSDSIYAETVVFDTAGVFPISFGFKDDLGLEKLDTVRAKVALDPPTLQLLSPDSVRVDSLFVLRAAGSTPGQFGRITKYEWSIGGLNDFVEASGRDTTLRALSEQASFPIALRVTDDDGNVGTEVRTIRMYKKWEYVGTPGF